MATGSPVSDVGSNILPQSEMGKAIFLTTLAFVHWTKTAFFGESLSNVIHY